MAALVASRHRRDGATVVPTSDQATHGSGGRCPGGCAQGGGARRGATSAGRKMKTAVSVEAEVLDSIGGEILRNVGQLY